MKKLVIAAIALAVLQSYGSTVMIVSSSNGSRDAYQLANVQKMTFQSAGIGVRTSADARTGNSFSIANRSLLLSIGQKTVVSVKLFSLNGRAYGTFPDRQYNRGSYLLSLDKNNPLARGVYILQVTMAGRVFNQRMLVGK